MRLLFLQEVEVLKSERNDAVSELKFQSKQLAEGVRRTGELQRFLSAELEQYQDVRESLMEIKNTLLDVRASGAVGSSRGSFPTSSGSPLSGGARSPSSSSSSLRISSAGGSPKPVAGLRAVALNQRRASNAGIAKASTFHPVSALGTTSSDSAGSGAGGAPVEQHTSPVLSAAQQVASAKQARAVSLAANTVAPPNPAPVPALAAASASAPALAPAPAAALALAPTLQPVTIVPSSPVPASRAQLPSVGQPTPAASPPRQRKQPLPTIDVDSSPTSDSTSKLVPTPRQNDPVKVGHIYRACSRAVLRKSSDPRSLAMAQYDPPRLDALAIDDTVSLKAVELLEVKTKEGKETTLFRVECELDGSSVGWTSIWAQNGKRLLDRVQKIKVIGLSGESVDVDVTASDQVVTIKKQAAPDASRALVVLDGEQVADEKRMSELPAGGQLRIVPRLGLKTPLRPPPSFHAQEDSMLTQLGEDLLEHVLRNLPSLQDKIAVTLSCRTLYSLRYVASLWKTLDFSTPEDMTMLRFARGATVLPKEAEEWHDTDDKLFAKVAHVLGEGRQNSQYNLAHGIRLQHCSRITDSALRCMAATYPKLTSIGLRGCKSVTAAGIKTLVMALGANCLTSLDIGFCDAALDDASVKHITRHCKCLTSLVLRGGKRLDKASAALLGRWSSAAELTELDLMGCLRLLTDVHLALVLKPAQNLSALNLSLRSADSDSRNPRDYHVSGASHLTDTCLRLVGTSCPVLTSLNLSDSDRLSGDAMVQLLAQLPKLKSLDLHKCSALKGTQIAQALADHIPTIEELDLSEWKNNVSNKTMEIIASLQRLRKLDIHGNACKSDGIAAVVEGCSALEDLAMSCQSSKLTTRLVDALGAAYLKVLTLIGVQQWFREQQGELVQALAPATGLVGTSSRLALALFLDCDADTVQELTTKIGELVSSQGVKIDSPLGFGGADGASVSSSLLPLNRSSHDELRGRLTATKTA